MPKYNLALIPISKSEVITQYTNQLSKLADKYLLGKYSLPHVTLYQFEAKEDSIENIWKSIEENWKEESIELEFKEFSCISFDKTIFWVSLLPNQCKELHKMHALIAKLLGKPIKGTFDPHMTLLNTTDENYEKNVNMAKDSYRVISDSFVLALGNSDDVGQLTKIIFKYEIKQKMMCKL